MEIGKNRKIFAHEQNETISMLYDEYKASMLFTYSLVISKSVFYSLLTSTMLFFNRAVITNRVKWFFFSSNFRMDLLYLEYWIANGVWSHIESELLITIGKYFNRTISVTAINTAITFCVLVAQWMVKSSILNIVCVVVGRMVWKACELGYEFPHRKYHKRADANIYFIGLFVVCANQHIEFELLCTVCKLISRFRKNIEKPLQYSVIWFDSGFLEKNVRNVTHSLDFVALNRHSDLECSIVSVNPLKWIHCETVWSFDFITESDD